MTDPLMMPKRSGRPGRWTWVGIGSMLAVGGCVNITAPDKPIEINLNISVTQQVVYRLDNQAKSLIQQNPGIF